MSAEQQTQKRYSAAELKELITNRFPNASKRLPHASVLRLADADPGSAYLRRKMRVGFATKHDGNVDIWAFLRFPSSIEFFEEGQDSPMSRKARNQTIVFCDPFWHMREGHGERISLEMVASVVTYYFVS